MSYSVSRPAGSAQFERLGVALTGRYQIEREIGSGAMASVYLARDLKHDRAVAMKVMHPEVAAKLGPGRFQREIRLAARLQHPHILPVYDSGTSAGLLWFTMPFVEGANLRQRLRQGGLPIAEAIPILWSLARALAYAHRNGVIHRDIKPENILLGRDNVYLADFGVAKPEALSDPHMTTVGQAIGTPVYMAPEQAEGDPATDHRADIYGFGILAYEVFAGNAPFGSLPTALASQEPDPVTTRRPDVPARLVSLIERCLRKDPGDRWQSADAIREVLEEALRPEWMQVASDAPSGITPARRPPSSLEGGLERARAAYSRAAWREAYDGFNWIDQAAGLDAEDLERLAEAAWWLSHGTVCLRARERAYRQYIQRGERRAAAAVALHLAEDHFHRLARAVGQGWLRRAERHLDSIPESPEHGWLCRLKLVIALEAEGNAEAAIEHADRALAIARRVGDLDLEVLALQDRGRALVALGKVREGMGLIDEAMTAATAGELSPKSTGRAYCNMMSTCEWLGDFGRAAEWYEVARGWMEPHTESWYPGICRVHRAGILRMRGALSEAEQEAWRAAGELTDFLTDVAGEAYYELGVIRLQMGDPAGAEQMFREAHARGRDPQPGLSLLRLAEGKSEAARSMIERAMMEPGLLALDRAKLLPALIEVQVACGNISEAAQAASELETIAGTYPTPALEASAALGRGRLDLARGAAEQAVVQLRRACRIWAELNLPGDLAGSRLLLSRAYSALGNTDEAELEERTALATIERVRAGAFRSTVLTR
jgi:tetratricopeptide (TPR) repeat protein/tRNA A-37 threonylcarbamoyl transferase component Bud32